MGFFSRKNAAILVLTAVLLAGCARNDEHTQAGMNALSTQSYDKALTEFQKAIATGEDFEQAYRGLGLAYMGKAMYTEAIDSFDSALSHAGMFPGSLETDINFYLATAQYKGGEVSKAVETLTNVIAIDEKNLDAYFLRGRAYLTLSQHDEGVADLEKALDLSGNNTQLYIDVYEALSDAGFEAEGAAYLQTLLAEHMTDMTAFEKGKTYFYLEDYEAARNSLETVRGETKKPDAELILMLGHTYEKLGDTEYAANLYQNYIDGNEPDAEIYNRLGLTRMEAGDYEAALAAFESGLAVEGCPLVQTLSFNKIVALEHKGDFAQAKKLIRKYIQKYPDDQAAGREAAFLESR